MSYCVTCKRYLNGALSCAGCGAEVGADGQPPMPRPAFRAGEQPSSIASGAESLPADESRGHGGRLVSGERDRRGPRWGRSGAVAAAAVVTIAVGAVILDTTTGGRQSSAPASHNSVLAGPGLLAPPSPAVGVGGSASGQPASAGAGGGATASSLPRALATETSGGGVLGGGGQLCGARRSIGCGGIGRRCREHGSGCRGGDSDGDAVQEIAPCDGLVHAEQMVSRAILLFLCHDIPCQKGRL